jgi:hypothetical protein
VAGSVGAIGAAGLSDEEQALFEELEREDAGEKQAKAAKEKTDKVETPTQRAEERNGEAVAESNEPAKTTTTPRRSEPEPG